MSANYSNFIPLRMRGQSWQIGNLSVLKILFAIVGVLIPAGVMLPFIILENALILVLILFGIVVLITQLLIWIPTSSGHSLAVMLWLKFVYKISYNN
ncbi:hypothetical protein [Mycoplasmopsis cynos]|uniref:hypothetical protein n=1 Tax=Mycoplasmopsis cynos TaxID=171284 RepID=UPI002B002024|nr:hypothetical protein [Mycoplasmopsis cynos]WQQ14379.1 hypothetical protein RRG42_02045 [Mycoplasmopsis cynos]